MSAGIAESRFGKDQLLKGLAIVLAMLGFAVLWFFLVHSVRIKELRYRLKTSTDQSSSVRTMSLVSRFRVLRQAGTDDSLSYAREGRIMQILADTAYLEDAEELGTVEYSAKLTIDFFDFVSGMPAFKYDRNSRSHRVLERAFYQEITRSYKEAIASYDNAVSGQARGSDLRSYGLLHRGFCLALADNRKNAATDFREVIATSSESEYVETARILLAMISEIDVEIQRVDAMPASVAKANAYYQLTAYNQAIGTLKEIGALESPEAGFFLARSLEETGNTAAAVAQYRKAIAQNPGSAYAMRANRRLFALGSFYAAGKEYRKESTANVERGIVQDKELLQEAKRFEKVSERIEEGEKKIVAAYLAKPEPTEAKPVVPPQAAAKPPVVAPPVAPPVVNPTAKATPPPETKITEPPPVAAPPTPVAVVPPTPITPPAVPDTEKGKGVSGPDWAKLEKLPRAEKIAYINRHKKVESVMLDNGNQFTGLKISENKERLVLFTALGRVVIVKSDIDTRQTVAP